MDESTVCASMYTLIGVHTSTDELACESPHLASSTPKDVSVLLTCCFYCAVMNSSTLQRLCKKRNRTKALLKKRTNNNNNAKFLSKCDISNICSLCVSSGCKSFYETDPRLSRWMPLKTVNLDTKLHVVLDWW